MMDSNDLIEYARRAAQLGTCWTRLEDIRRQSECLAGQVRQSKSKLKASILAPTSTQSGQASVIHGQNKLKALYQTTYLSLDILSEHLAELCVVATSTAQRVHALGLRPVAAPGEASGLTTRLSSALGELEEATTRAEVQLLELKRLVVNNSCVVDQLILDKSVSGHLKKEPSVGDLCVYPALPISLDPVEKTYRCERCADTHSFR
ncbi:hypothetical protein [Caballeronia sordidicola]|uniref:Uncharacterized protein n=1 Tax=Caballeronia sordidicola TaxID=196367 RepID=A0A226WY87_CABSO|nr:hypothetical protein [Caballeronia sordidicola]OXC75747.1 hypothetical protein BSU04_25320 [Caballeronia sordidicola]